MSNRNDFFFDDFILSNYRYIIELAKEKYTFINYEDISFDKNFILWRHDVDFSIDYALELAIIENNCNVKSTYFVLLHSDFYNPLENNCTKKIEEIIKLGHSIGLHFDAKYHEINSVKEVEKKISLEKIFLEHLFNTPIKVFSFHNPSLFELGLENFQYGGCINTYAKIFKEKIAYCSDSNGYWRHNRLYDLIINEKFNFLQILTHPEWWQEVIRSPKERVEWIVESRARATIENYNKILKKDGRDNIDWD